MITKNIYILKNTFFLYIRQFFLIAVNLFAIRILFNHLGVNEYGFFILISGLISTASFLPLTIISTTQRYLSFALGKKDNLSKVFSNILFLLFFVLLIAVFLLSTLGWYFVDEYLVMEQSYKEASKIIFFLLSTNFVISILISPFSSYLIAHENMYIYSVLSCFDSILKLLAAVAISITYDDKIFFYCIYLVAGSIISLFLNFIITYRTYPSCRFKISFVSRKNLKNIFYFAGWTFYGQLSIIFRTHAITLLINHFFNPVIIVARSIAMNLAGAVDTLANNFNVSLSPPITKVYSQNKTLELHNTIAWGSKFCFFLIWILFLPIYAEIQFVLELWLHNPPLEASKFGRLILIEILISTIAFPLASSARATGNMKLYELILGSINFSILPISFVFLKNGFDVISIFIIGIIANLIMFYARLLILRNLINLSLIFFLKKSLINITLVMIPSTLFIFIFDMFMADNLLNSILIFPISIIVSIICIYYFGLSDNEKKAVNLVNLKNIFVKDSA